jgi:predicted anti-sigma-YlaC factor YlaD
MFCDEALNSVEAIAEGELTAEGRLADHYATCPNCAAALRRARELEQMLQLRPTPRPSPQFTTRTMARVRRARWRSDQVLDMGFNAAIAIVLIAVIVGGWMVLDRSGLVAVSNDAVGIFGRGLTTFVQRIAPSLSLYAGATVLLATALGLWWWAERGEGRI